MPSTAERLCLTCGLCCNGVIFADVQLQRGDDAAKLNTLGLRLSGLPGRPKAERSSANSPAGDSFQRKKFSQPCAAFDGCRCRIYEDRPEYCRTFDCALLQQVNLGEVDLPNALGLIEKARRRAEKVRQILRKIGDKDEHLALSLRFRRTSRRLEQGEADARTSDLFSQLTLAVQDLNVLLSENFYPGSACG
ncbi:MAG: YkgJ family cysteine cluster protein [Verrucomicrobiota bacterium]